MELARGAGQHGEADGGHAHVVGLLAEDVHLARVHLGPVGAGAPDGLGVELGAEVVHDGAVVRLLHVGEDVVEILIRENEARVAQLHLLNDEKVKKSPIVDTRVREERVYALKAGDIHCLGVLPHTHETSSSHV